MSLQRIAQGGRQRANLSSVTKEGGTLTAEGIRELLDRDDPVILDIGANAGDTTLEILRVMPSARIYAFEPDPRAIAQFKASVNSPNVRLYECAVGDRNGTATFHQSTGDGHFQDWNQSGSIRRPKSHLQEWPEVRFETDITVQIVRLDDWARELDIDEIDFIWTDIQGAEGDLVAGGLNTINKARFFYTEYSDTEWYEGQITLEQLYAALPNFSILRLFHWDALFENLQTIGARSSEHISNIFAHYGITRELQEPHNYGALHYRRSNVTDLRETIQKIVPRNGGYPLIRIGGKGDGGYLIPDDLGDIEACFSPGVNNFKDFEDCLTNNYGIKAFMCDYSSDAHQLQTALLSGMQFFEKKWLDVNSNEISNDINEWVGRNSSPNRDLILQMDIEGAEYRNLLHASAKTLSRFRIMVVEFHDLQQLGDERFLKGVFTPTIMKIASLFTCVHAHPNNCSGNTKYADDLVIPKVIELTFLRNDRLRQSSSRLTLPHACDAINVPTNPPLLLEGIWLENADSLGSTVNGLKHRTDFLEKRLQESDWHVQRARSDLDLYARQVAHLISRLLRDVDNVAKGKKATQSSLSEWSTSEGPNGAINGNKTGGFGFHTLCEENPWWMVDLGEIYDISEIAIYNRIDARPDRSKTLVVSASIDGNDWIAVYDHNGRPPFGGIKLVNGRPPILITLDGVRARFVRLQLAEKTYLHLDEVEIYSSH